MKEKISKFFASVGLPRIIIMLLFVTLLASAAPLGLNVLGLLGDTIKRFGMYGILVLAMVPGIQCGINLNFGVSLGIIGGLVGALLSIELNIAGIPALVAISPVFAKFVAIMFAMLVGALLGAVIGAGYGMLLNRVKGSEMTVSTYVGFSVIAFMNILWVSLPFKSGILIWPASGEGLRNTINLADSFGEVFSNFGGFYIGGESGAYIPTGLLLFTAAVCFIVWLFLRSKTGMAMSAAGANPTFARASGINVDKMRILGTSISTALGAIGIITYAQTYGFLQLYNAPLMMSFTCVAAILIGGASTSRAKISYVIIGTFLFVGILAVALPVANKVLPEGNLSEVVRIIITNGIILYALTKAGGGTVRE